MKQSHAANDASASVKYRAMVISTPVLKRILEDTNMDGITFQFSQAMRKVGESSHTLQLIAYKHFPGRRSEVISDADFFVEANNPSSTLEVEIGDDGITSHFGNLKLMRSELNEDIDTLEYPYLFLWPGHGEGEYENYIVYEVFYANDLGAAPVQKKNLTRGVSSSKTVSLSNLNPSPPA